MQFVHFSIFNFQPADAIKISGIPGKTIVRIYNFSYSKRAMSNPIIQRYVQKFKHIWKLKKIEINYINF